MRTHYVLPLCAARCALLVVPYFAIAALLPSPTPQDWRNAPLVGANLFAVVVMSRYVLRYRWGRVR